MPLNVEQPAPERLAEAPPQPDHSVWSPAAHRRLIVAAIAVLCLLLLVVLPPYISVSRYQRRVAAAISSALGRPVHFDSISLQLLPVPGLAITNFVVSEDPAFGAEPILRANTVTARLRVASLWRRRIEVSRISLDAPSVNLVHRPGDGRWNLQAILQQASQLNSAPTSQARASSAPRFPYIEATDARINFKNSIDKLPFSIKEADFALWLPRPDQWHLRLAGRPVRTDTDVSDVGLLRVEGTLGRAADLQGAPIDLAANWKRTPLGEAAKLTSGYDLGWRGDASAEATLHGTVLQAKLVTDLHLLNLRRAEFVPEQTVELQAHCEAVSSGILRSLTYVQCAVPTSSETSFLSVIQSFRAGAAPRPGGTADTPGGAARPGVLLIGGEIPDLLNWHSIRAEASLAGAPPDYALAWMRLFSRRIPRTLSVGGTFDLAATRFAENGLPEQWSGTLTCACDLPQLSADPLVSPAPQVAAAQPSASSSRDTSSEPSSPASPNRWSISIRHDGSAGDLPADMLSIDARPAASGGRVVREAATAEIAPVSGHLDLQGYSLLFNSEDVAQTFERLLPPLGDGLPAHLEAPLEVERKWDGTQTWTKRIPLPRRPGRRYRRQ